MDPPDGYIRKTDPDGAIVVEYRQNGELHRDDGPARIKQDPDDYLTEEYYRNGKLHRDDGPARIESEPYGHHHGEYWYRDGQQHREDGPAVVEHEGNGSSSEEYWRNGKRHRDDGPAEIQRRPDGSIQSQYYWRDGTQPKDTPQRDVDPIEGYTRKTRSYGTIVEEYRQNGELHRQDGPARVERCTDDSLIEGYYRNGRFHREDGPAWIQRNPDGIITAERWCRDGELHREDGFAWIDRDHDGIVVSERWFQEPQGLHRTDGPAWIDRDSDGSISESWHQNRLLHRTDGPARIKHDADGSLIEEYYRNGKLHRDDGPAEIQYRPDGSVERQTYWRDGTQLENTQPNPINFYVVEYHAVEPFTHDGHDHAAGEIFYQEPSWGFTRDEADRDARNISPGYLDGPFKDALLKSVAHNSYEVRDATAEERNQFQQAHGGPYATYEHVLHQALEYYNHTCKTDRPPVLQNDQGDYLPASWTQFFDRQVWPLKEQQLAQEPARTTPQKPNCYMIDYVATEPFTYKEQHYEPGQLFHQEPTWRHTRDQAETDAANPYGYFGAYQDALQKSAERNSYSIRDATPEEAKTYAKNLLQPSLSDFPDTYEHVLHQALEYYLHTRNYSPPVLQKEDGDYFPVSWEEFFDEVVRPRREHERLAEVSEKQHDRVIGQIKELERKYKDPSTSAPDKERIDSYLNRIQEHADNLRESGAPEKQTERPLSALEKIVADAKRQTPQQDELQKQQELERQRQKERDRGR